MVKKRRRHAAAYKFRIALEAVEGGKTIGRSSNEYAIRVKKQDSTTRPYQSRLHPSGCNLFLHSMVHTRGPTSLNRAFYGG